MTSLHSSMPSAKTSNYSQAISRSNELLSCAKTAVKIAQRKHVSDPPPSDPHSASRWWTVKLSDLRLYDTSNQYPQESHEVLEDGLSLLHAMEGELKHLEGLVRRRGHTNDPTEAISLSVKRLELDTQELMELIQTMIPPTARGQRQRHWQILQQWFQSVAQQQGARLKDILKVRGKVLAEQAQRRKRFQASSNTTSSTANAQFDSPLFTAPAHRPAPPPPPQPPTQSQPLPAVSNRSHPPTANGTTAPTNGFYGSNNNGSAAPASAERTAITAPATAPPATTTTNGKTALASSTMGQRPKPSSGGYGSYYGSASSTTGNAYGGGATSGGYVGVGTGGYGGSAANASYYAGTGNSTASMSGMRQRRSGVTASASNQDEGAQNFQIQEQVQIRQQERQSQQRLAEARQAERSLATLGTVFGKMSTLLSQQAEVVDKVEDDVEAALVDVSAGQQEITILYSIKKGNRALIIKVFAILIFFIIFMRIYKK
jgi:hypothetical protein